MTRSAVSATTPILWVIMISPMPYLACRPTRRSRICFWIVTSSAVVGSSAISNFGSQAIAMAIMTRWHWPPDIWCGIGFQALRRIGNADRP